MRKTQPVPIGQDNTDANVVSVAGTTEPSLSPVPALEIRNALAANGTRRSARWAVVVLFAIGCGGILSDSTSRVSAAPGTPATLQEFWNGQARWSLVRKWNEDASHIEFYNGAWYLFERKGTGLFCQNPNDPTSKQERLGTQVRRSTDQGVTWSASPVDVLTPAAGTPWACAATDGDAFYDAANNKWRMLFQCLGADFHWYGCYAERLGADPMGAFAPTLEPAITADIPAKPDKALWKRICDVPADDCSSIAGGPGKVHDEGTFNIFRFDGTFYWVSFHGFDGVHGFRGIAKTKDFVSWVAGDASQGVPSDAIVDKNDAQFWRENWNAGGPIGAGAGSILAENGYYYLATEIGDIDLQCKVGQHWDWGLLRSTSVANTTWEQPPIGNPFVYSSRTTDALGPWAGTIPPCGVSYGQLFRDPVDGAIYFKYHRTSGDPDKNVTYLYKLVATSNVLQNGDLWMGGANGWSTYPIGPTNLVVYRDPTNAVDGNQYLATNCGTNPNPCQPGQSIYQDVAITGRTGQWLTFGGQFSTAGGTGTIALTVFQLDSASRVLQSNSVTVNATSTYRLTQSAPVAIVSGAAILRYQLYLGTSTVTFRADEMFANIDPSVPTCAIGTSWAQTSPAIGHIIGRVDADGWSANTAQDNAGYLQYGPNTTQLTTGAHTAKWMMLIDNNSADDAPIVRLEISDSTTGQILASRDVSRKQWSATGQYACFALPFTVDASRTGHPLQFRSWWYDRAYVREQLVGVD